MMSDEWSESPGSVDADELIVRAKTDRAALSRLYECYYPEVARYCLRRLFVRTVAEDVISDVFLEIATRLTTFPGRTNTEFRRWLFRITTNAINQYLRKSRRRQVESICLTIRIPTSRCPIGRKFIRRSWNWMNERERS